MNGVVPILLVIVLCGLPLLWVLGTYNGLVRIRNHCRESWSNIDTELKRRHDLIPNLVSTVQGYARHEREVLKQVTDARNRAEGVGPDAGTRAEQENALVRSVERLLAVVEAYPDLKADRQFARLREELVETEDRIQHVRRIYNANVRDLNNRVEMFPSSLVARAGGFQTQSYFQIRDLRVREAPRVNMEDV